MHFYFFENFGKFFDRGRVCVKMAINTGIKKIKSSEIWRTRFNAETSYGQFHQHSTERVTDLG